MARKKHIEISDSSQLQLKRSTSTSFMNATANKHYSLSDVRKHSSAESAWIVMHGHVYDYTSFLKDHPGGVDIILINAGTYCTEEFDAIHSEKVKSLIDNYRIGKLITTGYTSDQSMHGASNLPQLATIREATKSVSVALSNPREKIHCRLVSKVDVSHDVHLFRFTLPSSDHVLGLPVGKNIFICMTIDNKLCMCAYTPTSQVDVVGYVELLVKIYFKNENPKFPNGGMMS